MELSLKNRKDIGHIKDCMLCYVRTVFENIDFKKESLLSFDVNESTYQEFKSCGMSEIIINVQQMQK